MRVVRGGARLLLAACLVGACREPSRARPVEDGLPPALKAWLSAAPDALAASLREADGAGYQADSVPGPGGELRVTVRFDGAWPADTLSRPTHDLEACRPLPVAPLRGGPVGVADAFVWLVGVTHGPADAASRRATLALEGCALQPRLLRLPRRATLLVRHADAMTSRLRFTDVAPALATPSPAPTPGDSTTPPAVSAPRAPRAFAPFTDPGAVTPLTDVANAAGLVHVTDDHHPWVSGWVAVAPHPFVALSDEMGRVVFADVPPGRYVLVAWHERLGARAEPVLIENGVESRVGIVLRGAR